jgi:hypothetical protein
LFCFFVFQKGFPAIRHDWSWPYTRSAALAYLVNATSGWVPDGFGHPQPNLDQYLLAIPLMGLSLAIGPKPTLVLFMLAIAFIAAWSASNLFPYRQPSPWTTAFAVALSVFNPWTYTELVSGHIQMLFAYALTLGIIAALSRRHVRAPLVAVLLVGTLCQLQFFLIDFCAVVILAYGRRELRSALLAPVVAVIPVALGIALNRETLLGIPYKLAWEQQQSVNPSKVLLLMGYFTHYASSAAAVWFDAALAASLLVIVASMLFAQPAARRLIGIVAVALIGVPALIVTGTKGPIGALSAYAVVHLPVSGIFRELYDLVGYVAIGYICIAMAAATRSRIIALASIAAAVLLVVPWFAHGPAAYWVPVGQIRDAAIPPGENVRFALMPPLQPVTFNGQGSGEDPNVYARPGNRTPLNDYAGEYPAGAALMQYATSGDTRSLAGLSVASVTSQPGLKSNLATLKEQWAQSIGPARAPHASRAGGGTFRIADALPELSIVSAPRVTGFISRMGEGNLFFADIADGYSISVPRGSNAALNTKTQWVDATLSFNAEPEIAQPFGGVVTTGSAPLRIPPDKAILALVAGSLLGSDGSIYHGKRAYRWITNLRGSSSVRCRGFCVIAAFADVPAAVPFDAPARPYKAQSFSAPLPWFVYATVSPRTEGDVLRYNALFSRYWLAYLSGRLLTHIRIDHIVNGWRLPEGHKTERLLLIEWVAAVQSLAEIICILALLYLWRRASAR